MIKLFSLKQQKKDGEASPRSGNQKKASAAQLRITKGELFHIIIVQLFSQTTPLSSRYKRT